MGDELPRPVYIFRNHQAEVTFVGCLDDGHRLTSGDADGWVIFWDLKTRRPCARWRAHRSSVLAVVLANGVFLTQGREGRLNAYAVAETDQDDADPPSTTDHVLNEPAIMFSKEICSLTYCPMVFSPRERRLGLPSNPDGKRIDLYALPECAATSHGIGRNTLGLVMTLAMSTDKLVAGYETGDILVYSLLPSCLGDETACIAAHKQPVLSVCLYDEMIFTSSADAIIHSCRLDGTFQKQFNSRHNGQTALTVRPDGKILGTAGWDGKFRIFAVDSLRPLAVLKWHKVGCQAAAFFGDGWFAGGAKDGRISLWRIYPKILDL